MEHRTEHPIKISNFENPALLFLDEAEIGFHPEWQQKYLWIITGFLKIFSDNLMHISGVRPRKIQIIYTTHSPLSLTDLPKECVNFLERRGDKVLNQAEFMPQTFGENIFELYRNSFFMKDGLLGKIAERYIRNISDFLEHGIFDRQKVEDTRNKIKLIGDDRIRNYLLGRLDAKIEKTDLDTRIALKKIELEELERLRRCEDEA